MLNVELNCTPSDLQKMVEKIKKRLSDRRLEDHPLAKVGQTALEAHIWSTLEKEVVTYFTEHNSNPSGIENFGFIFGNPLNDLVFMVTPISSSSPALSHSFQIPSKLTTSYKFVVNYYVAL